MRNLKIIFITCCFTSVYSSSTWGEEVPAQSNFTRQVNAHPKEQVFTITLTPQGKPIRPEWNEIMHQLYTAMSQCTNSYASVDKALKALNSDESTISHYHKDTLERITYEFGTFSHFLDAKRPPSTTDVDGTSIPIPTDDPIYPRISAMLHIASTLFDFKDTSSSLTLIAKEFFSTHSRPLTEVTISSNGNIVSMDQKPFQSTPNTDIQEATSKFIKAICAICMSNNNLFGNAAHGRIRITPDPTTVHAQSGSDFDMLDQ